MFLSNWCTRGPRRLQGWWLHLSVTRLFGIAVGRSPLRFDPGVNVALVVGLPELTLHELLRGWYFVLKFRFLTGGIEAAEVGGLLVVAELDDSTGLFDGDDPSAVLCGLVHPDGLLRLGADCVVEGDAGASLVVGRLRLGRCVGELRWRSR